MNLKINFSFTFSQKFLDQPPCHDAQDACLREKKREREKRSEGRWLREYKETIPRFIHRFFGYGILGWELIARLQRPLPSLFSICIPRGPLKRVASPLVGTRMMNGVSGRKWQCIVFEDYIFHYRFVIVTSHSNRQLMSFSIMYIFRIARDLWIILNFTSFYYSR